MYLISDIFSKNSKRYTGIFALDEHANIKGETGMNLAEHEWAELVNVLPKIINSLRNISDSTGRPSKRKLSYSSDEEGLAGFRLYQVKYFLDGEPIKSIPIKEYYSYEKAELAMDQYKPVAGVDYPKESTGEITSQVIPVFKAPPSDTLLMKVLYVAKLRHLIEKYKVQDCSACLNGSDSQADHTVMGNCLDETFDFINHYLDKAMESVSAIDLMMMFDSAYKMLTVDPIKSKPYALAAKAYLSRIELVKSLIDYNKFPIYLRELATDELKNNKVINI